MINKVQFFNDLNFMNTIVICERNYLLPFIEIDSNITDKKIMLSIFEYFSVKVTIYIDFHRIYICIICLQ